MANDMRIWLWEVGPASGVTDDLRRSMARAEEHLTDGVALVERAVMVDSMRDGMLHIRTGTRWTGHRIKGGVQWAEDELVEACTALQLKRGGK
jgi:hypothetical protein